VWRPAVNTHEPGVSRLRQPILWLLSGLLLGLGFVSAFSGGLLFLVGGLAIAITLAFRYRGRRRGWSGLVYGTGASIAVLLLPYVVQPPRCVQSSDPGCFQGITLVVFLLAVAVAAAGLGLAMVELRRWRRVSRVPAEPRSGPDEAAGRAPR
jgi:hypothetical protein